jgi:hypothetical protein
LPVARSTGTETCSWTISHLPLVLRRTSVRKKNKTDGGHTLGHIRGRDLLVFSAAIVVPMKPFLSKGGHPPEIVDRMYNAWWNAMILQATLWVQPYVKEGDF